MSAELGTSREALLSSTVANSAKRFENVDDRVYKDWIFAALFAITNIIVAVFGLSSGIRAMHFIGASETIVNSDNSRTVDKEPHAYSPSRLIGGAMLLLFFSLIISLGTIYFVTYLSQYTVSVIFASMIAFTLFSGVLYMVYDNFTAGVLLIIISSICCVFYYVIRPYIRFASVNLKVAAQAIRDIPSMIGCAVIIALCQFVMTILWLLAVMGEATNDSNPSISYNGRSYRLEDCSTYEYTTVKIFLRFKHSNQIQCIHILYCIS